jgi:hypothetical protein
MLLTVFLFFLGWVFLTSAFVIIVKGGAALAPKPPGVSRYLGLAYSGEELGVPRYKHRHIPDLGCRQLH